KHICTLMAATCALLRAISFGYLLLVTCVLGNRCEGYGECGLNGICLVVKNSSHCSCPPGFDFVDRADFSKGCFQTPSRQTKRCSVGSAEMRDTGHVDWWGNDYQTITPINLSACKKVCLDDCFCTVVIYAYLEGQGYCWKKTLPLRDGRASSTRTAFVK
ncbi:hypothetical protein KI387_011169, partial [Taxus chinensis]